MTRFIAHSRNEYGQSHALDAHLLATARLAAGFAKHFGLSNQAFLAGLWHDAGKFNDEFQRYLALAAQVEERKPPRVPHSPLGAVMLASRPDGNLAAMPVAGHHSGLTAKADFTCSYLNKHASGQNPFVDEAREAAQAALQPHEPRPAELRVELDNLVGLSSYDVELLIRMLFSALVDADWLDTERHFRPETAVRREIAWPGLNELLRVYLDHMAALQVGAEAGLVNDIRHEVLDCCLEAAQHAPGVFRLTVPTGGGKTLASLGFALTHAVKHGLDRVIYAIPYTSIIEQTADVFRKVFASMEGPCPVIEHHSAFQAEQPVKAGDANRDDDVAERSKLASENWDAPLIVTTTVQLFDSLFANRPSRCRKLHNIANSVVILDEVQALPVELLEPLVSLLQSLVTRCRASVILCTATQPALSHERWGFTPAPREIVPRYAKHFEQLIRVSYERPSETWSWQRLADEAAACEQCLVVLNTKAHAIEVIRKLQAEGDADKSGILHLSTRLTGAHRRLVLAEVRQRLQERLPCRLISTQVVEAGVDLDFPVVMRAVGPLDRIVQAAGRCNREGVLGGGRKLGRVVVFTPEDMGMPKGAYRTASAQALSLLARAGINLNDPATYEQYFKLLYQVVDCDQRRIQPLREALGYPEVAQRGHLIESDTIAVVVPNALGGDMLDSDELHQLLDRIKAQAVAGGGISSLDWRSLQPHVINLWPYEVAEHAGELEEIAPGVTVWHGGYDPLEGIILDGPAVEDLIVDSNST